MPNAISKPKVTPDIDSLHIDWIAEHLRCDVSSIYQHHDGCVDCELHIMTSAEGFNPHLLRHHVKDLANAPARDRLAKLLKSSYNHVAWEDIVESISEYTLAYLRRPPKAVSSFDFIDSKPPEFYLWPFILRHENNMLFAPGGSGKSMLALLWLILLESAMADNLFKWIVRETPLIGLYLDWERSFNTHSYRMRGLLNGLELPIANPDTPLNYYRLHAPLAQEIRNVQTLINAYKASFTILDSCGMAAGGDMNKTEPAIQTFAALGALRAFDGQPLTNLLISHTSKDPTTSRKTPYGNAYWGFECSNIWEIIPAESQEHNLNRITLHCFKHNDYAWLPDMGLEIKYEQENITYKLSPPSPRRDSGELQERRIYDALESPMSPSDIAVATGIKPHIVSTLLGRLLDNGMVYHASRGTWERGREWPGEG